MNIKPHLINFLKRLNCILASSEKVIDKELMVLIKLHTQCTMQFIKTYP